MDRKEITVENMTEEEHRRLDVTANKALIVILILFIGILGALLYKYHKDYAKSGPLGRDGKSSPPSKDPASAPVRNAGPSVNMGKGLDQRQLDIMLDKGEFQEAEKLILGYLKSSDNNFTAIVQMGLLQYRLGNMDKALEYLESARKINEGDLFCLQLLGSIYTIKDPKKAVSFYEENLSYQMDRKDLSAGAIRAYHMVIAKAAENETEKAKLIEGSTKLLKELTNANEVSIPKSFQDLLFAENAYFSGKYALAINHFLKIPLSQRDMGEVSEKLSAATGLGIITLNTSDNLYAAYQYFEKALLIASQNKSIRPESTMPRQEQLSVIAHTLFDKPQLFFRLQRIQTEGNNPLLSQVKPMWDSLEQKKLIYSMVENKHKGKHSESIKDADKILKILDKKEGFFYDVAFLQPVFRGAVLIYIGDRYKDLGNKKEALSFYNKAKNDVPIITKISDKRIKELQ